MSKRVPENVVDHVGSLKRPPDLMQTWRDWEAGKADFEQLRAKVAETPGVTMASISSNATPPSSGWFTKFEIQGKNAMEEQRASVNLVSPGYFPTLRIPVIEGRVWNQTENANSALLVLAMVPLPRVCFFGVIVDLPFANMLALYAASAVVIVGAAAVGLLASVWCHRTRDAVLWAYLALLAGFCLTTVVLSAINAGILPHEAVPVVVPLAFAYGGIAQLIAGVLEFKTGNTFGMVAFTSYGLFWWWFSPRAAGS